MKPLARAHTCHALVDAHNARRHNKSPNPDVNETDVPQGLFADFAVHHRAIHALQILKVCELNHHAATTLSHRESHTCIEPITEQSFQLQERCWLRFTRRC